MRSDALPLITKLLVVLSAAALACRAETAPTPLSAEPVVAHMMEANQVRAARLKDYVSVRRYTLQNQRFGTHAEMTVRMRYRFPGDKQFEILSESGPGPIRNKVFRRMLATELDASREGAREENQISPRNYAFRLAGTQVLNDRPAYLLDAEPKTPNPLLFRGRIWVDSEDYAVVRIEGTPAKSPSFWVRKTTFVHQYAKFGPFWLATWNESDTDAVVFGRTTVRIEYSDYKIDQVEPPQ